MSYLLDVVMSNVTIVTSNDTILIRSISFAHFRILKYISHSILVFYVQEGNE